MNWIWVLYGYDTRIKKSKYYNNFFHWGNLTKEAKIMTTTIVVLFKDSIFQDIINVRKCWPVMKYICNNFILWYCHVYYLLLNSKRVTLIKLIYRSSTISNSHKNLLICYTPNSNKSYNIIQIELRPFNENSKIIRLSILLPCMLFDANALLGKSK